MTFFWQNLVSNPVDTTAAHELELYLENDPQLSPAGPSGIGRAVAKNMASRIDKGRYDPDRAVQGWMPVVDTAAEQYVKEFGTGPWHQMFDKQTRMYVAKRTAEDFHRRYLVGEIRL